MVMLADKSHALWAPVLAFIFSASCLAALQIVDPMPRPMLLAERFFPGAGWVELGLLAAWAAWLCQRMLNPERQAFWRLLAWSLFALVFFAQLALGLAGCEACLMTGELHLPVPAAIAAGPVYRGGGWFMPALFLFSALLVGPAWCSHLCYLGAADMHLSRLRKNPLPLPSWMRRARWAMLPLVLAVAAGLRLCGIGGWTAAIVGLSFGGLGLLVMGLVSRKMGVMVHCSLWCPMGLLATLLGKISVFRLRIEDGCTHCGACTPSCRYDALNEKDWLRGQAGQSCSLCGDCLSKCPHDQLSLGFFWGRSKLARPIFLALISAMSAIFLGLARI